MKVSRKILLPVLVVGLAVTGASFFSSAAYAQTNSSQTATQYFQQVWQSAPANLSLCGVAGTTATSPLSYYCGGVMTDSGTFTGSSNSLSVDYQQGDTLDCYVPAVANNISSTGEPVCSLTHNGATTYTEGGFTGASQTCTGSNCTNTGLVQAAGQAVTKTVSNIASDVGSSILQAVGTFVLGFANTLLGIAGVIFNLVMIYGVFQFANTIGNSPGVLTAWGILRDLANMALLFGFIFMGIATILDTGAVQGFTARRALPSLLIFAILMNFSLFTCEALIDVSNALSSSMYTQANTDPCSSNSVVGGATTALTGTSCGINYGLAGHIMQSTGLAGIWAIKGNTPVGPQGSGAPGVAAQATGIFGLALFATIGAIVFFAASIMLAIRLIVLTFLMVVSPIGFAGMAIPPLRNLAGNWWQRVIHQAFYAPIMLLLILISLKIADSFTSVSANNGLAAAVLNNDPSVMGVLLVFMLVIGFMVASLIVANRFGAVGATAAVNTGKRIVLGSYGGVAGFAGRRTIGAGGNWAQKKYKSNTALRKLAVQARLDGGIIKSTDAMKNAKFGSRASWSDKDKTDKAREHTLEHLTHLNDAKNAKTTGEMSRAVKRISESDLPNLVKELKGNETQLKLISESLSADKFEKLMNNKEFTDEKTKEKMKDLRFEDLAAATSAASTAAAAYMADPKNPALKKAYEDAQKALGDEVRQLGGKDATFLGQSKDSNLLNDPTFAAALSDDQFKAFKGNDNLTTVQKKTLEDTRNARLNDVGFVALNIPTMNPEEIGKLKSEVIANPQVLGAMGGRQLASIEPSKLNDAQIKSVVSRMKDVLANDPEEGGKLQAHLLGNVKNGDKWKPYEVL